jgi:hypothetical protein
MLGSDPPLSAADKLHAAKMRKGGASVIAVIAGLATQHQIESPVLQVAPMTANTGKVTALQPLVSRLATLSQHVSDLVFSAQSAAWVEGLQFYSLLLRLSTSDGELAVALQPVRQFFARRSAPKAAGAPTKQQARANAKAVQRLKKAAPQLLASTSQATAASSGAAPSTTATASGSAPPASSTPASAAASSTATPTHS